MPCKHVHAIATMPKLNTHSYHIERAVVHLFILLINVRDECHTTERSCTPAQAHSLRH